MRILIYGPPAGGKSTRARLLAQELGITNILERESYPDDLTFRQAVHDQEGDCIVIRCCFTRSELIQWKTLAKADRLIRVAPAISTTVEQAINRGTGYQITAIRRWYHSMARSR